MNANNDQILPPLQQILLNNNFKFNENNKIIIPKNIKDIKIDAGLSFDAPHSQNQIDNDIQNNNDIIVFGFEANPTTIVGGVINKIKVPVYNLKDFFDLLSFDNIEYIDYIKIDVQGYDINVIKGAGHYLSEKVVYVTAEPETEQYFNSHDNSTINMINYMTSIGFQHINHPNTKDPTFINTKFLDKKDEIYIWQYY